MKLNGPPNWLRWVLVIPAVILTYFIIWFATTFCMYETRMWVGAFPMAIWKTYIANIISVCTAMYVGISVAPLYKWQTSIVLACLWVAIALFIYNNEVKIHWDLQGGCITIALAAIYSSIGAWLSENQQ